MTRSSAERELLLALIRAMREQLEAEDLPLNEWTVGAYLIGFLAGHKKARARCDRPVFVLPPQTAGPSRAPRNRPPGRRR